MPYVCFDETVVCVTNYVSLHRNPTSQQHFSITSSVCHLTLPDTVVANYQVVKRVMSGFWTGKAIFGADLFCATPVEAMILLYMAESDGRSLALEDVSAQTQITIPTIAGWVAVLAERDLIENVKHSTIPTEIALRISATCSGMLDKLIIKKSSC